MAHQQTNPIAWQQCLNPDCNAQYPVEQVQLACNACGQMLDIAYDWGRAFPVEKRDWSFFESRGSTTGARVAGGGLGVTESMLDFSGVWRFRELLPFWMHAPGAASDIVTVGEGRTNLQQAGMLAKQIGFDLDNGGGLYLQYEGYNPSGSFKDNGMTAAFTHARMIGASRVACASTGNTSASLAMYAALTGMNAFVFIGDGKIAYGKLSQALDYGATTLQVAGDFDACLARVREIAQDRPELGVYLMNSVNPFRLEGQKTIMLRILEGLNWEVPDWIIVPGGNLGNCSAFAKAFMELKSLGMIDRIPRLAVINAQGASTLDRIVNEQGVVWNGGRYDQSKVEEEYTRMNRENERADTVASAIEINRPVNLPKALRALDVMDGVVRSYDDQTIVEHKSMVGRYGFGCEPASGASVAGARYLMEEGVIKPTDRVACVLTGHQLKDPDVTVGYHTGLPTKAAQQWLSEQTPGGPSGGQLGGSANQPIRVADDLDAIIAAIGT
ncbi:MAG: threonine synthase [Phycisphaerales bacterium]